MELKLETKFIEGTNEQYSIRNDGEVIGHKKNILLKKHRNHVCLGSSKNKVCVSALLKKYFNFTLCTKCKKRIFELNRCKCEDCSPYGLYTSQKNKDYNKSKLKKWKESNKENYLNLTQLHSKRNIESLSRSYIAHTLKIPVKDLTEELYQLTKTKILLIRLIKSKRKCQKLQ